MKIITRKHILALLAVLSVASIVAFTATDGALPPNPPRGVSVLNNGGRALRTPILTNCSVDMISLIYDWDLIETADGVTILQISKAISTRLSANPSKPVLLRINTMGGACADTGKTPLWVFTAMGLTDCTTYVPGVSYTFPDIGGPITIPVFWDPTYLAKKKAMLAVVGDYVTKNYASQVQVVVISYANASTEDWYIPHDNTGSPSEVTLWLNDPVTGVPPGAGYTTQKMIDAAIHQADASYKDGSITNGKTLNSPTANFTQADVGCQVVGHSYRRNTHIASWISATQVTLDRPLITGNGAWFIIKGRKDGLIDVAMAAFLNQYIATAVGGNGSDLDAATNDPDPGTYLARTVDGKAWDTYGNRYVVQRNNVTAISPTKDLPTDAWIILADAADAGRPTAGQALGACYLDESFQMNGGSNCDYRNPDCAPWLDCQENCVISWQHEMDYSGDNIHTYNASYYEVYPFDASTGHVCLDYVHSLLNPDVACTNCSP